MNILGTLTFLLISSVSLYSSEPVQILNPRTIVPANGTVTQDTRSQTDPSVKHSKDESIPKPIPFSWSFSENLLEPTYSLYISKDSIVDSTDLLVEDTTANELSIYNLLNNWTYYWKIYIREINNSVWETPVFTFTTADVWPRMLFIEGITNVRDIGGRINKDSIPIKQGLYYRSSEFNGLQAISYNGMQQLVDLGIVFEIDLRQDHEGAVEVLPEEIQYFRPDSTKKNNNKGGLVSYWHGIKEYGHQYRNVFSALAKRENYPVIVHCVAGADRAGTVTAILEAILNCTEEQILLNYQWTSLSVFGSRGFPGSPAIAKWNGFIKGLKTYDTTNGSINVGAYNYLLSIGISPQEIEDIRSIHFLEQNITQIVQRKIHTSFHTRKKNPIRTLYLKKKSQFIDSNIPYFHLFDLKGRVITNFNKRNLSSNIYLKIPY